MLQNYRKWDGKPNKWVISFGYENGILDGKGAFTRLILGDKKRKLI